MPKIDLTSHACAWCGTMDAILCDYCHKYCCRDCRLAVTEEGCIHKTKKIINRQTW